MMEPNSKVKVRIGLEIHQRLDTYQKLFSHCSNYTQDGNSLMTFFRQLIPVKGEMGLTDSSAKYEFLRKREFKYHVYSNNSLIEMDEEPPTNINSEALDISLQVATMLNCRIPDEIQIMRKTVIDGSNTSGFQRTCLIGTDGFIDTPRGRVRIQNINLEEESSGVRASSKKGCVEYDLDRLNIPLVEIGTETDILDGAHCKETALTIGTLLRALKVKRGIGTIRQDVNISIERGARVEIKGFQDVKHINVLIDSEIERQKNLVEIKEELAGSEIAVTKKDVTEIFSNAKNKYLVDAFRNGKILGLKVTNIGGFLKRKLCHEMTLGRELSFYLKAFGIGGFIHSDEDLKKYEILSEWKKLEKILGTGKNDLAILIALGQTHSEEDISLFLERISKLKTEVPEETRKAHPNYTSSYMRPLPGKSRMYPETDVPSVFLSQKKLEEIKNNLPEQRDRILRRLEKVIGSELARQIVDSEYFSWYTVLSEKFDGRVVANLLINTFRSLRDKIHLEKIERDGLSELLDQYSKGIVVKSAFPVVLEGLTREEKVSNIIKSRNLQKISNSLLKKEIKHLLFKHADIEKRKRIGIVTGEIMAKFLGRVEGEDVSKIIKELI